MISIPQAASPDRLIVVYSVHVKAITTPIWIGIAPANKIWTLADAKQNLNVAKIIEADGNPTIIFHLVTDDEIAAKQLAYEMGATPTTLTLPRSRRAVRRLDTGETFRNASEAARAFRIDPANLSKHLRRCDGHETVGGLRFAWV